MPYKMVFNPVDRILEITFRGAITQTIVKEIYKDALSVLKENNGYLILGDYHEAIIETSSFEIFELPKIFAESTKSEGLNTYRIKRALIPPEDMEDFKFFQIVCSNCGQNNLKLFPNIEEAKAWLTIKETTC